MLAKQKFDWQVDPLQLATRFDQVDQFLDDPILIKKINKTKLINFFQNEALKFKDQILKK